MSCPSEVTCLKLEHPEERPSQADSMVTSRQQLQPLWRLKRRSALDRHAAFVRRLECQRLAREKSGQESVASKVHSESRLHAFTKKLRHAILHNADVASVWQPAAHVLDIKATLDRKLKDQSFASAATQASHPGGEKGTMSSKLLNEMAQFVDEALRDAPASCNNQAANDAALGSVSNTKDSNSHADVQPSADAYKAETDMPFQQAPNVASTQAQDSKEQAPKCLDRLGSSASVRSISSKIVNKPAWAMTADAAQAAEQQEEEDLLAFAGGLEFDKYINQQEDAELRTVLQEMRTAHEPDNDANKATLKKHVVRAINNLASKDAKAINGVGHDIQSCCQRSDGGASTFSRATVASKAKDASNNAALLADTTVATTKWDTSTKAGADVGSMGKQDLKAGCGELFRENPEMKQVHSLASAAALLKAVADSTAA